MQNMSHTTVTQVAWNWQLLFSPSLPVPSRLLPPRPRHRAQCLLRHHLTSSSSGGHFQFDKLLLLLDLHNTLLRLLLPRRRQGEGDGKAGLARGDGGGRQDNLGEVNIYLVFYFYYFFCNKDYSCLRVYVVRRGH